MTRGGRMCVSKIGQKVSRVNWMATFALPALNKQNLHIFFWLKTSLICSTGGFSWANIYPSLWRNLSLKLFKGLDNMTRSLFSIYRHNLDILKGNVNKAVLSKDPPCLCSQHKRLDKSTSCKLSSLFETASLNTLTE